MRVLKALGIVLFCILLVASVVLFFMRAEASKVSDKAAIAAAQAVAEAGERPYVKLYATSDELAAALAERPLSGATVLVKGSHGIRMEKVIPTL